MRFVAGEVARYKQIRRLEVIDAIPKSAAGKTLRRVLRDSATP
jgi:acyl-coenzyme A synthetase/AMP-(fatty) acid ligase